jgi:Spy/CpxP family protein refolding chaperone
MSRLFSFAGVVLAVTLVVSAASAQQPGGPRQGGPNGGFGGGMMFGGGFGIPGYEMLPRGSVEKELGLSDEQKDKLKDLRQKIAEARRNEPQFDFARLRSDDADERDKALKELNEAATKRADEAKTQLAEILTPKQVDQLKEIAFRQWASARLALPQSIQQVDLTDDQNKQLQTIRDDLQSKMVQLQRENFEKALAVLTPEQLKKLKEQFEKQPAGAFMPFGRPRQAQRPQGE